ncbi:MAG: hypothetical protein NZ898_04760 [Myxococcota bacterium]|nr:hypothetical protein [Myxococcota bacterium]MDW8361510.1 hypothetical protein [Myxococcales bacterium]
MASPTGLGSSLTSAHVGATGREPEAGAPQGPAHRGSGRLQHTVLGLPQVASTPTPPAAVPAVTHRTMLGTAPPAASPGAAFVPPPTSQRTMLGIAPPAIGPASTGEQPVTPVANRSTGLPPRRRIDGPPLEIDVASLRASWPPHSSPRPARRRYGVLLAAGLGGLALFGLGIGAWALLRARAPEVQASVETEANGEVLAVRVIGAESGSRVRFGGVERPLLRGAARLPLSADALRIGENRLTLFVVDPDGSTHATDVELSVDYRVRVDSTPLAADSPGLDVVVHALPGSRAWIDSTPVALDDAGRGVRRIPVPAESPAPAFEHELAWRVELPNGRAAHGRIPVRVAFATLQIDRPGDGMITDRTDVEVAGLVAPGARVTVDGTVVPNEAGRFAHRVALTNLGERRIAVRAVEGSRAPRQVTVTVRRVADLEAEAAAFRPDPDTQYANVAARPAALAGRRAAYTGRVYNVDERGGRTIVQMLVRDCPIGERCPLWVVAPAGVEVANEAWVRVFGTLTGEQQFRSTSDRIVVVPRLDAVLLLPERVAPTSEARRRSARR